MGARRSSRPKVTRWKGLHAEQTSTDPDVALIAKYIAHARAPEKALIRLAKKLERTNPAAVPYLDQAITQLAQAASALSLARAHMV